MVFSENCLEFIFTAGFLRLISYNSYLREFKMRFKKILTEILGINIIINYWKFGDLLSWI